MLSGTDRRCRGNNNDAGNLIVIRFRHTFPSLVLIVMILQIICHATQNMERCQVGSDAAGSVAGEFLSTHHANQSLFQEVLINEIFTQFDYHIHHLLRNL